MDLSKVDPKLVEALRKGMSVPAPKKTRKAPKKKAKKNGTSGK